MIVFLDCGAFNGCSARKWLKLHPETTHVYSFEPDPRFWQDVADVDPRVVLVPKAAWIADGSRTFWQDRSDAACGGTLYKDKRTGDLRPIPVETVDISRWIRRGLKRAAHVALKLDIEGAEYAVLERMHEQGTLGFIDELYVEWHQQRIPSIPRWRHDQALSILREAGITAKPWDAIGVKTPTKKIRKSN
ncbi:MAG: FkbM family methyltransferase [Planctomycetota bacterium]